MLKLILSFYYMGKKAIDAGAEIRDIFALPVRERIGRAKYTPEQQVEEVFYKIETELKAQMEALTIKDGEQLEGI